MVHPHDIFSLTEPWTSRIIHLSLALHRKGEEVRLAYFPLREEEMVWREFPFPVISLDRRRGAHVILKNIFSLLPHVKWAEVIHFQKCFPYCVLPVLLSSWIRGKPLHYDWDDWEYHIYHADIVPSRLVGKFLGLWELNLPHLVETLSVSSQNLYQLARSLGVREDRIFRAPVGVDLGMFHPGISGEKVREELGLRGEVVLYMGQLHGGQYVELFIEASALLKAKYPEVNFLVVGGGYREESLREYSRKLKAEVVFTGMVPHEKIPEYISAADICIACFEDNPVTRSKSPLKIVEYMACGKPVVASDVGEVRRMLGDAGIIVSPGDSRALAEGIEILLLNPEKRRELGKRGRERVERIYNWDAIAENLRQAYRKALFGK